MRAPKLIGCPTTLQPNRLIQYSLTLLCVILTVGLFLNERVCTYMLLDFRFQEVSKLKNHIIRLLA